MQNKSKKIPYKVIVGSLMASMLSFSLSPYVDAKEQSNNSQAPQPQKQQSQQTKQNKMPSDEEIEINKENMELNIAQHEVHTYKEFVNSKDPDVVINPSNLTDKELQKLGYTRAELNQNVDSDGTRSRQSYQKWSQKFTMSQIQGAVGLGANVNSIAGLIGKAVGGTIGAVASVVVSVVVNVLSITGAKGVTIGGVSYLQKHNPRTGDTYKKPRRVYQATWAKPYY